MHPIHPMVVHFPIALLIISVLFDAMATQWRHKSFQDTGFYTLIAGLLGAVVAVVTGAMAEEVAEGKGIPESVLEIHEALGYATLLFFLGLLALRLLMRWKLIKEIPALYLAMGIVGIAILTVTGYVGGSLVFDFGAGVNLSMEGTPP
ncbi:MAG: DUF2231 domain-containing protein [Nitrospirae bacterium]|nr:MAG: DUF2231 domain-containing protein [Nitrospirota bacterium]